MKNFIVIFLTLLIFSLRADCSTITHPERKNISTQFDKIFFTGGIDKGERLFINNKEIFPNEIGAFCYYHNLDKGENVIIITTINKQGECCDEEYRITQKEYNSTNKNCDFIKTSPHYYKTKKDNVILRSTPINAGINRLGYLPKDTKLYIDGCIKEYSRVYLTKDNYAWVLTEDIEIIDNLKEYMPQKITKENYSYKKNSIITEILLSDNLPYSVNNDTDNIVLTIYNLDNDKEFEQRIFPIKKLTRYSIYEKNNTIKIVFKNIPKQHLIKSAKGIKIVIDAGHGGYERGAIGCLGDMEKDLNLNIAKSLEKILKANKYDVYLTRNYDEYLSLQDRIDVAKEKDALLFISIHLNSVPINENPNNHTGATTYFYNNNCREFAEYVLNSITRELSIKNNGVKQASFAVIRPTEYIGILLEVLFMVNPNDTIIYKSPDFVQKTARGISNGIEQYLKNITAQQTNSN